MPPGTVGDWFYPKDRHRHHLLSTIASLVAKSPRPGGNNEQPLRLQVAFSQEKDPCLELSSLLY